MDSIDKMTQPTAPAELYAMAMEWLEQNFYKAVPSPSSKNSCYHQIFTVTKPERCKGITYPKDFRIMTLIGMDDLRDLQEEFNMDSSISHELREFMIPLITPSSSKPSAIQDYTLQLIQIESERLKRRGQSEFDLGISFQPSTCGGKAPRAFIPEKNWFKKSIHEIELRDIFTIFPDAEVEMIAMLLGRAVVGRSKHVPVGWGGKIEHTSRLMGVVYGHDAGTGKSFTFNSLVDALRMVGYDICSFNRLDAQFNMDEILSSHLAYCDDTQTKALEQMLKSRDLKTIVTNGTIRVENKGQDAFNTPSHTTLLLNINEWNPRMVYGFDTGVLARIRLITTRWARELNKMTGDDLGPASYGSPNIYPFAHWKWLCKKYDIELNTLLLWGCRLCADYFWELIKVPGEDDLLNRFKKVSSKLRTTFDINVNVALTKALFLSHSIRRATNQDQYFVPEISVKYLTECVRDFQYVAIDLKAHHLRTLLKADWESKDRPDTHPWMAIRKLQISSIDVAIEQLNEIKATSEKHLDQVVKATFGGFMLRSGFKLSSDIVWVASTWNACRGDSEQLHNLSKELVEKLKNFPLTTENQLDELFNPNKPANTDHIYDTKWSPEVAEKLANEALQNLT